MKKIIIFVAVLLSTLVIAPIKAEAKNYSFSYLCDEKQKQNNETFSMTCHIYLTATSSINHIEGELILQNVNLESIKTNGDWTNDNGLSTNVSFTSKNGQTGTFLVADLVFTGNLKAYPCEASFKPTTAEKQEENHVCQIVNDQYYGKNGAITTEEKYYEECCNYVCTVVNDKYYFNTQGKSVSYDEFLNDCSTKQQIVESPQTGINYGYIFLPIGIISIIAVKKTIKKKSKIYKI